MISTRVVVIAMLIVTLVAAQSQLDVAGAYNDGWYGGQLQLCVTAYDDSGNGSTPLRYQVDSVFSEAGIMTGEVLASDRAGYDFKIVGVWYEAGYAADINCSINVRRTPASIGAFEWYFVASTACLEAGTWSENTNSFAGPFPLALENQCRRSAVTEARCYKPPSRGDFVTNIFSNIDNFLRPSSMTGTWRTALGNDVLYLCGGSPLDNFDTIASYQVAGRNPGTLRGVTGVESSINQYAETGYGQWGVQIMILTSPTTAVWFSYRRNVDISVIFDPTEHNVIEWFLDTTVTTTLDQCRANQFAWNATCTEECDDPNLPQTDACFSAATPLLGAPARALSLLLAFALLSALHGAF